MIRPRRALGLLLTLATMIGHAAQSAHGGWLPGRKDATADAAQFDKELNFARLSERHGKIETARQVYEAVLRRAPQTQLAHHRLGVIGSKDKDFESANYHFEQALNAGPPSAELLSDIGYSMYLQDRPAEARQYLESAIGQYPQYKPAYNVLGLVLAEQGQPDEALRLFKRVVSEAEAQANLAYIQAQLGQLEDANRRYHLALSLDNNLRPAAEALLQLQEVRQQLAAAAKSGLQAASEPGALEAGNSIEPQVVIEGGSPPVGKKLPEASRPSRIKLASHEDNAQGAKRDASPPRREPPESRFNQPAHSSKPGSASKSTEASPVNAAYRVASQADTLSQSIEKFAPPQSPVMPQNGTKYLDTQGEDAAGGRPVKPAAHVTDEQDAHSEAAIWRGRQKPKLPSSAFSQPTKRSAPQNMPEQATPSPVQSQESDPDHYEPFASQEKPEHSGPRPFQYSSAAARRSHVITVPEAQGSERSSGSAARKAPGTFREGGVWNQEGSRKDPSRFAETQRPSPPQTFTLPRDAVPAHPRPPRHFESSAAGSSSYPHAAEHRGQRESETSAARRARDEQTTARLADAIARLERLARAEAAEPAPASPPATTVPSHSSPRGPTQDSNAAASKPVAANTAGRWVLAIFFVLSTAGCSAVVFWMGRRPRNTSASTDNAAGLMPRSPDSYTRWQAPMLLPPPAPNIDLHSMWSDTSPLRWQ